MVVVILIVLFKSGNSWMKEQLFHTNRVTLEEKNVRVLRNGKVETANVEELLVGDIQFIEPG